MRLYFECALPEEEVAKFLAQYVYGPDRSVSEGVPFRGTGPWWELSWANDHKLDVVGGGQYRIRDRYHVPERLARYETALRGWEHARNVGWR